MVEFPEIKLKQYVIVPRKPKMSPGKIASQVAHATYMALENHAHVEPHEYIKLRNDWRNSGMCVIVLQCKTTEQLSNIAKYFEQWKIPHHLYIDEGLTEIDPMTPTALATGVLPEDKHWIFSQFELFGTEKESAQDLIEGTIPKQALLTNDQYKKLENNYKFVWGEKPIIVDNDYQLRRLVSIADGIIPGNNKF